MNAIQITYHFEHTELRLPEPPAVELRLVTVEPPMPLGPSDLMSARCLVFSTLIGGGLWFLLIAAGWLIFH
ncbi:MAG: hypothetical protein ABI885_26335 [Gammaproteobacteria bacterium]